MDPIKLKEVAPVGYSLWLEAGATDVDDLISGLGHEPNGYFWEGIVQLLVATEAGTLGGRFECDPEGGAFVAYSEDRGVLDELAGHLRSVATDRDLLRTLVEHAESIGYEFDD